MQEKNTNISRREFGKRAAMGTSAFAGFGIINSARAAGNEKFRVGLIGCGGRGNGAVQNAVAASENVTLVAVHDVMEHKAKGTVEQLKRKLEAKNVQVDEDHIFSGPGAYKGVLESDLDYVILATPPGFRPEHFEAAVDAKLHIFTEKPVATDPVGIRRFMAAAKKSEQLKLSIVAGTQRRHQKPYVETIKKIHDGALGEIVAGRAYWNGSLPFARERKPGMSDLEYQASHSWYSFCWICGDNIVEQHVHNLDIMNWVLQAHPVSVIASGGRCWKPKEERYGNIWDHFSCDFEYPNGVHVMSFCRHLNKCYNEVSELVTGTNRQFRNGQSNCRDMGEGGQNPYVQEHAALQASMRGDSPYLNEGIQVAESVMTAIMGRMAAYTGEKLSWEEALNSDLDIVPKKLAFDIEIPVDPIPVPGRRA